MLNYELSEQQKISRRLHTWLSQGFVVCLGALLALISGMAHATLPIESWKTANGAKVMFMRAEALPMVDVRIDFPAGSRHDPADKVGLADMVSNLLGSGAAGLTEDQIADQFADTGASFSADAAADYAGVQLRTLTDPIRFEAAIALFSRVVRQPEFKQEILEREVSRAQAGLKDSLTKPAVLASRAFMKAMYPAHPYGAQLTAESLQSLTLKDIQNFYQTHYLANYAVVSIVGNLTREQATQLANRLTEGLPQANLSVNPLGGQNDDELQKNLKANQQVLSHPSEQSHILMGLPAMRRGTPDYFDLLVANHVIGGGGFVSRLMNELREKRGLAYSVSSYFMPLGDAGPYQISMQTRRDKTNQSLELLNSTLNEFIEKGPSAKELEEAKKNLIGGFPLRIDSNADLIANLSMMGVYNMPLNYLDTWTANIQKVTISSAKQAFARHVRKDRLITVVVGGQP